MADYTEAELAAIERWVTSMIATLRTEAERLAAIRGAAG
jgi:hypothetical protein